MDQLFFDRQDIMTDIAQKMQLIKLIVLDVDGVLTDGTIIYTVDGSESKAFSTQDGFGITMAQQAGLRFGALTGRISKAVERRVKDLKFEFYKSGHLYKVKHLNAMIAEAGLQPQQVLYMGDDIVDLACAPYVGLFVAPANAQPRIQQQAAWVTEASGGNGAVREIVNTVLQAQRKLEEFEQRFLNQSE